MKEVKPWSDYLVLYRHEFPFPNNFISLSNETICLPPKP